MKTVVVGIVQYCERYLLVSSRKNFGRFTGFFYPVAGHVKPGEDELRALGREFREEGQMDILSARLIAETGTDVPNQRTRWFDCRAQSYEFSPNIVELADAGYFTREQMRTMPLWPMTRRFFEEFIFTR